MCRAEPWLKSLHVEFTTGLWARGGFQVSGLSTPPSPPTPPYSLPKSTS